MELYRQSVPEEAISPVKSLLIEKIDKILVPNCFISQCNVVLVGKKPKQITPNSTFFELRKLRWRCCITCS